MILHSTDRLKSYLDERVRRPGSWVGKGSNSVELYVERQWFAAFPAQHHHSKLPKQFPAIHLLLELKFCWHGSVCLELFQNLQSGVQHNASPSSCHYIEWVKCDLPASYFIQDASQVTFLRRTHAAKLLLKNADVHSFFKLDSNSESVGQSLGWILWMTLQYLFQLYGWKLTVHGFRQPPEQHLFFYPFLSQPWNISGKHLLSWNYKLPTRTKRNKPADGSEPASSSTGIQIMLGNRRSRMTSALKIFQYIVNLIQIHIQVWYK